MQMKTIEPMQVLCFETQTTMQTMLRYVRVVAHKLHLEAAKNNIEATGPVYWIYKGADGKPDTVFTLTIAVPVAGKADLPENSEFKFKTLEKFDCISEQHLGDWGNLGETYGKLFSKIQSEHLQINGTTREIYLNMDFENLDGNITEVQIGIAG